MSDYGYCDRCGSGQKLDGTGMVEQHKAPHTQHVYALCDGSGLAPASKIPPEDVWMLGLASADQLSEQS